MDGGTENSDVPDLNEEPNTNTTGDKMTTVTMTHTV
jgi:hypothetical protein